MGTDALGSCSIERPDSLGASADRIVPGMRSERCTPGSMAYDENNTSGFAKYGEKPMVAVYTAHNMETGLEQQCIAYSLDQGKHFENIMATR